MAPEVADFAGREPSGTDVNSRRKQVPSKRREFRKRCAHISDNTGYTPMVYEIFGRTPWGAHRASIESAWKPYVEGKRTLPQATAEFARAIHAAARR